ncbi:MULTISPECIES: hypothetical protein [unclassified Streptomyces]|uniref:hypothetical protein n=1 Tax=unclassified Streptomyces TaxID=2593676 RepID=UPI0006B0596C|nr:MULTISPECIES: hypothetical protein [unclassified Streptomyces]KOX35791.1 hypothetical protein ADL06_06080 [Streptomyces sp. NRRL F-6491]KOX39585.1 hypothetical protein ADL08_25070 [Streptomyces sp. NRRL F-6492]
MSRNVLLLPLPAGLVSIDDLPADHEPPPVGSRADVHAALEEAFPGADLTDPAWGELLRRRPAHGRRPGRAARLPGVRGRGRHLLTPEWQQP